MNFFSGLSISDDVKLSFKGTHFTPKFWKIALSDDFLDSFNKSFQTIIEPKKNSTSFNRKVLISDFNAINYSKKIEEFECKVKAQRNEIINLKKVNTDHEVKSKELEAINIVQGAEITKLKKANSTYSKKSNKLEAKIRLQSNEILNLKNSSSNCF